MISLQSLERIDYVLAASLIGIAVLMLIWNLINVMRLSRLGRKLERVESELEKKVLEMEKLRKERQEMSAAKPQEYVTPPPVQNQGIEIVTSGVAVAPGVEEAVAQDISATPPPVDNAPALSLEIHTNAPEAAEPSPSVEPQIEIVQSGQYTGSEPEQVFQPSAEVLEPEVKSEAEPEPLTMPQTAPDEFSPAEPMEFDIDLGSRDVKEKQAAAAMEPDFTLPSVSPLGQTPARDFRVESMAGAGKAPEPTLEQKMIDGFEETTELEISIRMFNPLKRSADFRAFRDALAKATERKASKVNIDLSEVFFIYPQETAELNRLLNALRNQGAQVHFAGVSSELNEILKGQGIETNPA